MGIGKNIAAALLITAGVGLPIYTYLSINDKSRTEDLERKVDADMKPKISYDDNKFSIDFPPSKYLSLPGRIEFVDYHEPADRGTIEARNAYDAALHDVIIPLQRHYRNKLSGRTKPRFNNYEIFQIFGGEVDSNDRNKATHRGRITYGEVEDAAAKLKKEGPDSFKIVFEEELRPMSRRTEPYRPSTPERYNRNRNAMLASDNPQRRWETYQVRNAVARRWVHR